MDLGLVIGGQWEIQELCFVLGHCNTVPVTQICPFSPSDQRFNLLQSPFFQNAVILPSLSMTNRDRLKNAGAFPLRNDLS